MNNNKKQTKKTFVQLAENLGRMQYLQWTILGPKRTKIDELMTKLQAAQRHKIKREIVSLLGLNTAKIWIQYII